MSLIVSEVRPNNTLVCRVRLGQHTSFKSNVRPTLLVGV